MRYEHRTCSECDEPLTPNSAVFDGWGQPKWYCMNEECENFWLDQV